LGKSIYRLSAENAFYFSFAAFVVVWLAGFLYEYLEETPGRLNLGVVILIILSLNLILFLLAITNILLLDDPGTHSSFARRLAAVLLFILLSAVLLSILALLFWIPV
jgi:hypothetical protein